MSCFQSAKWRPVRASMFAGLGLWGVAPVIHQCFLNSHVYYVRHAMMLDSIMGFLYLVGGWGVGVGSGMQ